MSSRGESITQRILRGNRRFENPLCGLNARPIQPVEQSGELNRRQLHHAVHDRRPAERSLLQLLPDQHQAAAVPDQYLQAVAALGAIDNDRTRERILGQRTLRQITPMTARITAAPTASSANVTSVRSSGT